MERGFRVDGADDACGGSIGGNEFLTCCGKDARKETRHEDGMHYPERKCRLDMGNHVARGLLS